MNKNKIKIDKLVRSKRKTIGLMIDKDAKLTVRAPLRASMKEIRKVLEKKNGWIEKKKRQIKERKAAIKEKVFENGGTFYFLGRQYPLLIVDSVECVFELDMFNFVLHSKYKKCAKDVFEQWYRIQAKKIFVERADLIAEKSGLRYKALRVSGAKTLWGSCSMKGSVNLSWRLIMAPLKVIDYVIIHELSHTRVMNHSAKFWEEVEKLTPDYQKHIDWLKVNGDKLAL